MNKLTMTAQQPGEAGGRRLPSPPWRLLPTKDKSQTKGEIRKNAISGLICNIHPKT